MIRVLSPGLFTTVQDLGRHGYAHLGVSPAGAADPVALRIGNRLVGNEDGAAAFEFTLQGGRYEFEQDAIVALTGADFERAGIPMWRATGVTAGSTIEIGPARTGARGYLCVRGGLDVPLVMHSASTHVLSGIGGPLKRGDSVAVGYAVAGAPLTHTEPWPYRKRLRITAGAQAGEFDARQAITLASETYQVSDDSNRMGLRLKGAPLAPPHSGQMLSEGVPLGAIQIPPSGRPIILFVDAQTTGGYPVIASVISADLASVGQLRPRDSIAFEFVSLAEARRLLFEQEAAIDAIR
jgi:antagonist of KipI